jgi:hypothetical protein
MADSVPPEVAAAVQCRESITFSQGKYAKTNSTSLYSTQLPAASEWTFNIPDHCPPSLAVASNGVHWELTTIVRAEGLDLPVTFELLVLPEVVS